MIPYCKPEILLSGEDESVIVEIIESGMFCLGEYSKEISEYFKDVCRVQYAIPCCNATNGLIIALRSTGITNKYVAMPSFTWGSTLYASDLNNNSAVFIDIKQDKWTIDETKIPPMAQAVIAVDTFGVDSFIETKLPIIYDAAHAYCIDNLGNRGLAEVVSFSFTKRATAMQGGVILTNNRKIAEEAEELVKLSAKITEVNAYILFKSLETYYTRLADSVFAIQEYKKYIKVPFTTQKVPKDWNHSVFGILLDSTEKRNRCSNRLLSAGYEIKSYYKPLYRDKYLTVTNDVYDRILCLPVTKHIFPYIKKIAEIINNS